MNYPELEDIFLQFSFDSEKNPAIKEINSTTKDYLDRLIQANKLSKSEASRIRDLKSELEIEARTLGFKQGFHLAVKLFLTL